ncbi:MAG: TonB-dependent receptor, partial [Pedobacter sp.]
MKILLLPAFILLFSITRAQTKDTLAVEEVRVKAYFSEQSIKTLPASVSVIDLQTLQNQAPFSLVGAVNSAPGVRMEERSPASYRLSIRGSVLRSPFGVRNVKVYMDDFSLTDAGGNTYLNLLDAGSVSGIELIKGPEGSIYGANTGGVMLLQSFQKPDSLFIGATLSAASNNTFLQRFSFQQRKEKYQIAIQQGVVKSNGYREHSNSERKYLQLVPRFNYAPKAELKALLLFSDLQYETPGGITQEQFDINPRSARAQAVSQQAEIFNKTLFGGVSHEFKLSNHLR